MVNNCETVELVQMDGVWVLMHEGREYVRLIDATSRDDAERQISELLSLCCSAEQITPNSAEQEVSREIEQQSCDTHLHSHSSKAVG